MQISHPVSKDVPGGDTDIPHRRRRLLTGIAKAVATIIGIVGAVVTLCHNLGCL
jgi:hypothetical protein